jgi:hypothetical protein
LQAKLIAKRLFPAPRIGQPDFILRLHIGSARRMHSSAADLRRGKQRTREVRAAIAETSVNRRRPSLEPAWPSPSEFVRLTDSVELYHGVTIQAAIKPE